MDGEPPQALDADERAELERLRREVAELRMDREFLKKALEPPSRGLEGRGRHRRHTLEGGHGKLRSIGLPRSAGRRSAGRLELPELHPKRSSAGFHPALTSTDATTWAG